MVPTLCLACDLERQAALPGFSYVGRAICLVLSTVGFIEISSNRSGQPGTWMPSTPTRFDYISYRIGVIPGTDKLSIAIRSEPSGWEERNDAS